MTDQIVTTSIIDRATQDHKNWHEDFINLCGTILTAVSTFLASLTKCIFEPLEKCFKILCKDISEDEDLMACCSLIFCSCWAPPTILYFLFIVLIIAAFLLPMGLIILMKCMVFVMIGIWPAFILTFYVTATTIYRAPFNLYYTLKIVQNCQVIEPSTKLFMLTVTIPTVIVVPIVTFVAVGICSFGYYFFHSAAGFPLAPWKMLEEHYALFWKYYVEKAKLSNFEISLEVRWSLFK